MKKHYLFTLIFSLLFSFSYSQISSFPHSVSFETGTDLGTSESDVSSKWSTYLGTGDNAKELVFQRKSGATTSSGTGPSSASAGSWYVYIETSGSNTSDEAQIGAQFNLSGITNARMTFDYHTYGESGTVGPAQAVIWIHNNTDSVWEMIWQTENNYNAWQNATVDLSDYDGKTITIWFVPVVATANDYGAFQSDFALDNIKVGASGTLGEQSAVNYYVDDSGSDSNNGLTSGAPFLTLSKAIETASDGYGDIINVAAGTYRDHTVVVGKSLTIRGAGYASTIFENNTTNKGFMSIISSNVTIEKLKVKDYSLTTASSDANKYDGAGIRIGAKINKSSSRTYIIQSGISLNDIYFEDNINDSDSGDGGAVGIVTNPAVGASGGGSTSVTINSCIFDGNKAGTTGSEVGGHNGGAIMVKGGGKLTVNNSIFFGNIADYSGAGVSVYDDQTRDIAELTINNSTLYNNTSYSDDTGFEGGGVNNYGGTISINNSILHDNSTFDIDSWGASSSNTRYSIVKNYDVTTADGFTSSNEGTNPLFTNAGSNDFTLQDSSIGIDAGSSSYAPADDYNDLSRPQGQQDDIGAYEHANKWDGSTDTDWKTTANWRDDIVPVSGRSPIIADVTNQPVISSDDGSSGDVTLEDITINSGAELTINKEASLTLTDDFTNNSGTVYLESDSNEFASIIVQGDASGNITYKRYVNAVTANGWDLIGSPVDGLDINTFVSANSGVLATNGVQVAVGTYSNSNNDWSNYTTDGSGAGNINAAGNFDIGKGYQMGTVDGGSNILQFTGTIATADQLQAVINNHGNGDGRRWNLVANPFPSYLMLNDDAHASNNFLTVNNSIIDGSYLAVYGYDADGSGFTAYGQDFNSNTAKYVAPGQAFMVAASSSSSANLSVTEAMLTTTGSDDFISGDNMDDTEIYLKLYNGDQMIETTHIKFQENMTLGLDPGYDLGNYYQGAAISTRLVENDEGNNFEHQQLPPSAMENAVIPLVINQSAGQEFRINLHTATIPDPNVYLEDVEEGTFTNLYEGDFVYTPTSDLEGVGRFFIHMTADTMSNEEVSTSMLNAYKEIDASYITIEGLATQTNETNVSLYNILGREVLSTTLNNNMGTQTISTVGLSAGIYVIELESGTDRLTKKLIIK